MDESKPDRSSSDKQETEEILVHNVKHPTQNRETHGLRDDIDANTPIGDVKGPNVFERVKEEFEAIVEAIHQLKEDSPSSVGRDNATPSGSKHEKQSSLSEKHMGSPIKCKVENSDIKSETHKDKSPIIHHKETHGRGEDIDADIPISEFKGPSIFHRAKEEIEALVDTIHTKKDSDNDAESPKKEGGFRASISKKLHRIRNRD